jgi:hypothetical protein
LAFSSKDETMISFYHRQFLNAGLLEVHRTYKREFYASLYGSYYHSKIMNDALEMYFMGNEL